MKLILCERKEHKQYQNIRMFLIFHKFYKFQIIISSKLIILEYYK